MVGILEKTFITIDDVEQGMYKIELLLLPTQICEVINYGK